MIEPGSITWQRAGDARVMLMAGCALLLQVAHPTVGAGVSDHSSFQQDPWGRLLRTLDYAATMVYAGPQAATAMARALRGWHGSIRGVGPGGRPYSALEPEAFAWVHATLADGIVRGHERFGVAFDALERDRFWREWRALGTLLEIGEGDLPATWAAFEDYRDRMVAERLAHTTAVDDVLALLARPLPPAPLRRAGLAWRIGVAPAAALSALVTAGMLPPVLRERFGLRWTRVQERELRALARAARAATPVMPRVLRVSGPAYLRLRSSRLGRSARSTPATPATGQRP